MDKDQLEQVKRKTAELLRFNEDNERIERFLAELKESSHLNIKAAYQMDLFKDEKQTYELVGAELIELLEQKLAERRKYVDGLTANDLLTSE
jgi:uncharacterized protein YqgQ